MRIKLKKLVLQNFKGCKERTVSLVEKTEIFGANATGKTTILDAFMWLLFDKDSTGATKFQVRPLDAEGKQIDNVEIMVEGTLDVDGKEVILKKVQKQIWRKRRGTDVTELQGNENLFEINGYPKSEKDYKDYISGLVDEELFKLITNPQAFVSLPWKKQREVLMRLVDDVSDVEIAQSDERFSALIPELEQASTDDIQKKYKKALDRWKDRQKVIPELINERSMQLVDIDVAELELQRNYLREQIAEVERQQEDSEAAIKEYDKHSNEILRLKGEMRTISDKANHSLDEARRAIQSRKDEAQRGFEDSRQKIRMTELDITRCKAAIERQEAEKKRLQDEWRAEKAKTFPEYEELPALTEDDLVCPTCGQALPEELKQEKISQYEQNSEAHRKAYEADRRAFEANKKDALALITQKGNATVAAIKESQSELKRLETDLEQAKADSIKFNKESAEAMEELNKMPVYADLSANQEYESLQLQVSKMEDALSNMSTGADYRSQLRIKLTGLREELSVVEKKIASADNTAVEERIAELQEEQREVGQKVADQEKMIFLLESFIREKMNRISESINAKFNTVSWKLFANQINGGMKETCECMVNGVPYSSLNNGHKIIAGLDIISSLSALNGMTAPVFIDNAEALNDFNIPEMDCQMVLLKVSDDAELKVVA